MNRVSISDASFFAPHVTREWAALHPIARDTARALSQTAPPTARARQRHSDRRRAHAQRPHWPALVVEDRRADAADVLLHLDVVNGVPALTHTRQLLLERRPCHQRARCPSRQLVSGDDGLDRRTRQERQPGLPERRAVHRHARSDARVHAERPGALELVQVHHPAALRHAQVYRFPTLLLEVRERRARAAWRRSVPFSAWWPRSSSLKLRR